jgi:hypothetical protein
MQIEDFENVDDKDYKYQFAGTDSESSESYKTKLLVGQTYSFYYLLGVKKENVDDVDTEQKYTEILT